MCIMRECVSAHTAVNQAPRRIVLTRPALLPVQLMQAIYASMADQGGGSAAPATPGPAACGAAPARGAHAAGGGGGGRHGQPPSSSPLGVGGEARAGAPSCRSDGGGAAGPAARPSSAGTAELLAGTAALLAGGGGSGPCRDQGGVANGGTPRPRSAPAPLARPAQRLAPGPDPCSACAAAPPAPSPLERPEAHARRPDGPSQGAADCQPAALLAAAAALLAPPPPQRPAPRWLQVAPEGLEALEPHAASAAAAARAPTLAPASAIAEKAAAGRPAARSLRVCCDAVGAAPDPAPAPDLAHLVEVVAALLPAARGAGGAGPARRPHPGSGCASESPCAPPATPHALPWGRAGRAPRGLHPSPGPVSPGPTPPAGRHSEQAAAAAEPASPAGARSQRGAPLPSRRMETGGAAAGLADARRRELEGEHLPGAAPGSAGAPASATGPPDEPQGRVCERAREGGPSSGAAAGAGPAGPAAEAGGVRIGAAPLSDPVPAGEPTGAAAVAAPGASPDAGSPADARRPAGAGRSGGAAAAGKEPAAAARGSPGGGAGQPRAGLGAPERKASPVDGSGPAVLELPDGEKARTPGSRLLVTWVCTWVLGEETDPGLGAVLPLAALLCPGRARASMCILCLSEGRAPPPSGCAERPLEVSSDALHM